MYTIINDQKTNFCQNGTTDHLKHVKYAPTLHNIKCDGQSTWNIIHRVAKLKSLKKSLKKSEKKS